MAAYINKEIGLTGNLIYAQAMEATKNFSEMKLSVVQNGVATKIRDLLAIPKQVGTEWKVWWDLQEMLKPSFDDMVLPSVSTLPSLTVCGYALIKFLVSYTIDSTLVEFGAMCLNGKVKDTEYKNLNLLDFYLWSMPTILEISKNSIQFVHVLANPLHLSYDLDLTVYFTDGTSVDSNTQFDNIGDYRVLQFGVGYNQLDILPLLSGKVPYKYTVSISGNRSNGTVDKWQTLTFLLKEKPMNAMYFCFKNEFGLPQFFEASGNMIEQKFSFKKDVYDKPLTEDVDMETGLYVSKIKEEKDTYKCSTGFLSRSEAVCFKQMLRSEAVYLYEDSIYKKIEISDGSFDLWKEDEEYNSIPFEFIL